MIGPVGETPEIEDYDVKIRFRNSIARRGPSLTLSILCLTKLHSLQSYISTQYRTLNGGGELSERMMKARARPLTLAYGLFRRHFCKAVLLVS